MEKASTLKPMSLPRHLFAIVTLGLLCGWYYFILLLYPILAIFALRGSMIALVVLLTFISLSVIPLQYKPWPAFMSCWIWSVWREYFDIQYSIDSIANGKLNRDKRYMFFEFPHGIFPMGQFLSSSMLDVLTDGWMVKGTGADIIFMFPIMRHIMVWIGTYPAKRSNITKIFKEGCLGAIIPGGIAEMYLIKDDAEQVYLNKRHNTVKAAIQEGANIIPTYFFGNTKIFHRIGGSSESFVAKISRKLRASIMLFYGRFYLPVPYRHPLLMATGEIVEVVQNDNPSEEYINEVLEKVKASLMKVYNEKKPSWETRPLVIC